LWTSRPRSDYTANNTANNCCLFGHNLHTLRMKHFPLFLRFGAAMWFGLAATDGRAALAFVGSEAAFDSATNDSVSWNQRTTNVGEPNPLLLTNSQGGIQVIVGQPSGSADFILENPPFPSGQNVFDNQGGGDVTLSFDHPLAGFGVDLQDAFNGYCIYTITAYNVTATATNALGYFFVTNNAGSHVTFVGVQDSTPEITRITLKDGSANSTLSYFLMGQIGLVKAVVQTAPVLAMVSARGGYALQWPTNATGFHVQVATNLSPTIAWQALGGSAQVVGGNYSEFLGQDFGNIAFFRLANVSP